MPGEENQEFGDPSSYPYLTVASPSCHDTSTTRAWYEQDPERRQRYYNQVRFVTYTSFLQTFLSVYFRKVW